MPRLYCRNGWWYIELRRGVARSLKTTDKAQARKRFNKIKSRWADGKLAHLTGECHKTLGEYLTEFEDWSEANQPRATFRANRLGLRKLKAVCGGSTKLDRISLRHLDEMVTKERLAGRKDQLHKQLHPTRSGQPQQGGGMGVRHGQPPAPSQGNCPRAGHNPDTSPASRRSASSWPPSRTWTCGGWPRPTWPPVDGGRRSWAWSGGTST